MIVLTSLTAFAAGVAAPAAGAATDASACSLAGAAHVTPGLSQATVATAYTFHGDLANCTSSSTAPATGTISAGEPITISGVQYRAPAKPTGNMGCVFSGSSDGKAIVKWPDGGITVLTYSTASVGLIHALIGTVAPYIDLTRVQLVNGNTVVDRIPTTKYLGYTVNGPVAFAPTGVQTCTDATFTDPSVAGALVFAFNS